MKTVDLSRQAAGDDGLAVGTLAGRWRIEHELGRGGMGIVYAVVHADIGKRAALKILHRRLFASSRHRDRVLTEARVVNQIEHPSIVDIFDTGTLPDGLSYIVMERLDGESLAAHATTTKILPDEAIAILIEICDALDAAHGVGVLHRDLKLENVFLVPDPLAPAGPPRVKLLDWGIAKVLANEVSATLDGQLAGTPQYVSPEHARGQTLTPKSDIYSLGVMAYQLFLEALPFDSESVVELLAMHLHTAPPAPRDLWPDIPEQLESLLLAMLAKQPEHRPTLRDVVRGLETTHSELVRRRSSTPEQPAVTAPRSEPPPIRWIAPTDPLPQPLPAVERRRARYTLGVGSLLALAVLFGIAQDSPDRSDVTPVTSAATVALATEEVTPGVSRVPALPPVTSGATVASATEEVTPAAIATPSSHDVIAPRTASRALERTTRPVPSPARIRRGAAARTPAPTKTSVATQPAPTVASEQAAPTVRDVVAKYQAVGRRLAEAPRQREVSHLWTRYRLVQIQDALRTPESRTQVARLLERLAIELTAQR